jgi:methionyl-tRNA formyltransferase
MRIVFIGASALGYTCCEAIINAGYSIVGVLTLGKEFSIKYKNQTQRSHVKNYLYKDFNDFTIRNNVPVVTATEPVNESYQVVEKWKPDLIVVIGWYYFIPQSIMKLPPKGVIGIHASLLPKYRGNAPLVWAMINGETETGVSLFYIEKGVDEGDIIGQKSFTISEQDYIADVLQKASDASVELLRENLPLISADKADRLSQDHTLATIFPKRSPEDGLINWEWETKKIKDFIRAQSKPYPGAFTIINNKKLIIWQAEIVDQ